MEEDLAAQAAQTEINTCKQLLAQTDYQALKHADGALGDDEYAQVRGQRAAWRARINELEQALAGEAEA